MVGGGSTEHKPRCRVPATDRVSQGRGAWRLQEKLTLDQSKPSADPDWNKQRAPKRTRPLTPPERPVNVPNAPESPAFLKAMLRVGEAKRPMTMPPPGMPPSRMVPLGLPPQGLPPAKERLPPPRLGGSVASQIRLLAQLDEEDALLDEEDALLATAQLQQRHRQAVLLATAQLQQRNRQAVAQRPARVGSVAPHGQYDGPVAPHGPQISSEAPQRRQKKDAGRQEVELWSRRVEMQW